jgi:hypothetical protein
MSLEWRFVRNNFARVQLAAVNARAVLITTADATMCFNTIAAIILCVHQNICHFIPTSQPH